jgi:hypothetical protein
MKMVLVFDTDDRDGMNSCLKIFKQLARDNGLLDAMAKIDDPKFGKIEFIKMLQDFDVFAQDCDRYSSTNPKQDGNMRLKDLKEFADRAFDVKSRNSRYIPNWKR